eukprot:19812_5
MHMAFEPSGMPFRSSFSWLMLSLVMSVEKMSCAFWSSCLTPLTISFFYMFLPIWSEEREARAALLCALGSSETGPDTNADATATPRARAATTQRLV